MTLTIGLYGANLRVLAAPSAAAGIARLAEDLGYDSLWVGDHVVLPTPRVEPSPMEPAEPLLDPVVSLGFLAAHTSRIALAAGVVVLPQRNPLVLAKQLATVDVLSGGRLVFGAGVGYLEPELTAIGVPLARRGARTEEYLAAIQSLWYDEKPEYHGEFVDFAGVDAHPRPVRRVPVVLGGHSTTGLRRALRLADGWYGYLLGLRATKERLAELARLATEVPRETPLHVSITPSRLLTPEIVADYAELGVDRLVVAPLPEFSLEQVRDFVEANAPGRLLSR
ncbi:TIGR03619 family F420-dependent LLM class oxidoreductase [Actinophytocola oryzae]|uniref:Putative F420-dependent oxidoreductase n=1 Tax=Actinophytocola oryzae TaxID=502181 RepID=A0A4R7W4G2_9PSEU|nr:TIGR03619 family F420-dependent LLM class oxidoreductase [Actinophytocola oryzae]TDV57586.1 putative F420-dependent oxidoreductase [Actinophytocola oryzae]